MANVGSSYDFILNNLPYADDEIFVDAATSWGIGGLHGESYSMIENWKLQRITRLLLQTVNSPRGQPR